MGLTMAVGAALQGGVGFGMNLLAAPVLALVEPKLVPGPLLLGSVLLTVLLARRERATVDQRAAAWALIGRVPGTVAGAFIVALVSAGGVAIGVGIAVLGAALLNVLRLGFRPTPPTLVVAGVVSGVSGTVAAIGGPPLAVVFADQPGPVVRGTMSAIFVVGGLMSVAALAVAGEIGRDELLLSLAIQPAILLGYATSRPLTAHIDAGRTRAAVLLVSAAGAVAVIATELG